MGKKGVLLDNGKKAQSSMTLYWKNNKQRAKAPKEKKQKQLTMEQDLDQRAVSGFQKWKLHKQKLITKAYTKKQQNNNQNNQKEVKAFEDDEMEQQIIAKQKKDIHIPGYGKRQKLIQKLQVEKVPEVDQSKNILRIPQQYGDLSQQDIIEMLRAKKRKEQFATKRHQRPKQQQQDIILGEDLYQRKKVQKQQQKPQIKEPVQIVEAPFFKSDILNDLSKGKKLENIIKKQQVKKAQPESQVKAPTKQSIEVHQKQQHNKETVDDKYDQCIEDIVKQQKKVTVHIKHAGFLPRALRK